MVFSETKDKNIPLVLLLTFSSCLNGIPHARWSFYWFSTDRTKYFKHYFFLVSMALSPADVLWWKIGSWQPQARVSWTLITLGAFFSGHIIMSSGQPRCFSQLPLSLCQVLITCSSSPVDFQRQTGVSAPASGVLYDCCVFITWTCRRYEAEKEDILRGLSSEFYRQRKHSALMDSVLF